MLQEKKKSKRYCACRKGDEYTHFTYELEKNGIVLPFASVFYDCYGNLMDAAFLTTAYLDHLPEEGTGISFEKAAEIA